MGIKDLEKNIIKYGIKPGTERELSLFSLSCLARGYSTFLSKLLSFSYKNLAGLGENKKVFNMLNEERIIGDMSVLIKKGSNKKINIILKKTDDLFKKVSTDIILADKYATVDPKKYLLLIIKLYPEYMSVMGVYNCFWRYLGNNEKDNGLTTKIINEVAKKRQVAALIYPQVEKNISTACLIIGKSLKINDLLRYATFSEMKKILFKNYLNKKIVKELSLRKKAYFYLYKNNTDEIVITDKQLIKDIKNKFFTINKKEHQEIKGYSAFKGLVKGRVFNVLEKNKYKTGTILVTNMTRPEDLVLLKNIKAIITDEGGILCHAAIIARELKKPCIIGTKIATQILKGGQLVEVDANKGIVKIIK